MIRFRQSAALEYLYVCDCLYPVNRLHRQTPQVCSLGCLYLNAGNKIQLFFSPVLSVDKVTIGRQQIKLFCRARAKVKCFLCSERQPQFISLCLALSLPNTTQSKGEI